MCIICLVGCSFCMRHVDTRLLYSSQSTEQSVQRVPQFTAGDVQYVTTQKRPTLSRTALLGEYHIGLVTACQGELTRLISTFALHRTTLNRGTHCSRLFGSLPSSLS